MVNDLAQIRAPAGATLLDFIKLTRPTFLLGGVLLYGLGVVSAIRTGTTIQLLPALLGQLMVTAIQLMAQYANEYFDLDGDRLNASGRTFFSGGSGILPAGKVASTLALHSAYGCAVVGLTLIVWAAWQSPRVAAIAAVALIGSWFYSAPPLALIRRGWGELSASLIVALLVPLTGALLQRPTLEAQLLFICVPLVLIHWAMLIAFELPDRTADEAVGKCTQTVRLGQPRIQRLHTTLLIGALGSIIVAILTMPDQTRFLWLAAPLLLWQIVCYLYAAKSGQRLVAHILTTGAVASFAGTTFLSLLGLWFG